MIKGDLISSEDTTLAGRVEGNVDAREHALVIAPGAQIEGDVHARTVAVHGVVTGTVKAEYGIELGETGSVFGNIVAPRMSIAEGAVLQGHLTISRAGAQDK